MARTAFFGVLGPFVGAALAAVGCEATVIYIETAAGTTTTTTTNSTTTSASGGAGGALLCAPGATQPCYSGPAGTEGQGICEAGAEVCAADGMSWGACVGEVLPGVEDCATAVDEDCDGLAPPCKGELLWAKRFGDGAAQAATAVAVNASGDVFVTGRFDGTIDFGGGPLQSAGGLDVFVAKLDATGGHVWSRRFGGSGDQWGSGIALSSTGDVLVVGNFTDAIDFGGGAMQSAGGHDVFVLKLSATGDHVWSKRFGDAEDQLVRSVAADGAGNVVLAGALSGVADFGAGPLQSAGGLDAFVTKLDAGGGHLWSHVFGDGNDQDAKSVTLDDQDNVLLVGVYTGSMALGGSPLQSDGGGDVFLAKLDMGGGHVWSKGFGDAGAQAGWSVATDSSGAILLAGGFEGAIEIESGALQSAGGLDMFAIKAESSGGPIWGAGFGDGGEQSLTSVAVDGSGNVLLTGRIDGAPDFGDGPLQCAGGGDLVVVKLDAIGGYQWAKRFGDAAGQFGSGIAADAAGNAIAVGYFAGTIDFGAGPLVSAGGSDVFIAAFGP